MSNQTLTILKVMLKTEDVMDFNISKGSKLSQGIKMLGMFMLLTLAGFSFSPVVVQMYDLLAQFQMQAIILKLLLFSSSVIVVIFGFFFIMNVFYFSSDVENYLYLPVKAGSLVIGKFAVVAIYQILSGFTLFYPSFVVYGYVSKSNIWFYFQALLAMILVPIAPLALIGILTMIMMRFSKIFKNKDLFTTISTFGAIIASVGLSIGIQNFANSAEAGTMSPLLSGTGTVYNVLSVIFPGTFFMHKAMTGDFLAFTTNTFITLLISGSFMGIFYLTGNLVYIDGAKGLKETGTKRIKLTAKRLSESGKGSHPVFSIARKELKILLRSPIYLINCVVTSFIMPLFLILPILLQGQGSLMNRLTLGMPLAEIRALITPGWVAVAIAAVMAFYAGLNMIPATSISREGSNFYILKYLPVSYMDQIKGKILPGFLVQLPAVAVLLIPLVIILQPSAPAVAAGLIAGFLLSLFVYLLTITVDIIRPVLNWTSEQKAVKQNFNAALSSIMAMVFAAIPVLLSAFTRLDKFLILGIISAVCLLLVILLIRRLPQIAQSSFADR